MRSFLNLLVVASVYFYGVAANTVDKPTPGTIRLKDGRVVYASAEEAKPVLKGQVPDVAFQDLDGNSVKLLNLVKDKPAVVIFYRGGWCPYCNRHLQELQEVEDKIKEKGYQIIAITPDRPAKIKEFLKEKKLGYSIYSDSNMEASIAFGLAFKLPDQLVKTYKDKYKIDVEDASGHKHHLLPVPAAYVVKADGKIQFAFAEADYKTRVDIDLLMGAL